MGERGALGREYEDGEIIVREGEIGDSMHVIQEGRVEVVKEDKGNKLRLAVLAPGDFFGEMAVFEKNVRSATVRALGHARVLTIDKRTLFRRIQEDPALAFRMIETLARRVRSANQELVLSFGREKALDEDKK
jgi:CRP/FNR family cyclic AMP-dependent transcriptional regulator